MKVVVAPGKELNAGGAKLPWKEVAGRNDVDDEEKDGVENAVEEGSCNVLDEVAGAGALGTKVPKDVLGEEKEGEEPAKEIDMEEEPSPPSARLASLRAR